MSIILINGFNTHIKRLIVEECVHCKHFMYSHSDTASGRCEYNCKIVRYNQLCKGFKWSDFAVKHFKIEEGDTNGRM